MAANTAPIFVRRGDVSASAGTGSPPTMVAGITAAEAGADLYVGTSTNARLVFTADATEGSYLQKIKFKSKGTNVATVARIYLNNGSTAATATNNSFYGELSLIATTASATVATLEPEYLMNIALNPGFRVYVTLGTAVAAGWVPVAVGGLY